MAPPPDFSIVSAAPIRTSNRWKFCFARKLVSFSISRFGVCNSSIPSGIGASSRKDTRSRDIRACSAKFSKFSRRFGCLISSALANRLSRLSYVLINSAAVLMPIPGTPGTLSVLSPASDCTSITRLGITPNFSTTSSAPMRRFFIGSSMVTSPRTSCIKSLSEDTIIVARSLASATAA